jgi:hypothetical protein
MEKTVEGYREFCEVNGFNYNDTNDTFEQKLARARELQETLEVGTPEHVFCQSVIDLYEDILG